MTYRVLCLPQTQRRLTQGRIPRPLQAGLFQLRAKGAWAGETSLVGAAVRAVLIRSFGGALHTQPSLVTGQLWERPQLPAHCFLM